MSSIWFNNIEVLFNKDNFTQIIPTKDMSFEENINAINNIREVDSELGIHTGIIADLQGPKLRIGKMPKEGSLLLNGNNFILDTNSKIGCDSRSHPK